MLYGSNCYNSKSKGYLTYNSDLFKSSGIVRNSSCHNCWSDMARRCFSEKYKEKNPTYADASMDEQWLDFQEFAEFYTKDIYRKAGWGLDKDIIFPGNKIYGPDTCCFLPAELNSIMGNCFGRRGELPYGVSRYNGGELYRARVSFALRDPKIVTKYSRDVSEILKIARNLKKEALQEQALFWKNFIDPRAYESLMSWEFDNDH